MRQSVLLVAVARRSARKLHSIVVDAKGVDVSADRPMSAHNPRGTFATPPQVGRMVRFSDT